MFGIIVLLHNTSALELEVKLMAGHSPPGFSDRVQNSWFLRCMAGRPGPEDTKQTRPSR